MNIWVIFTISIVAASNIEKVERWNRNMEKSFFQHQKSKPPPPDSRMKHVVRMGNHIKMGTLRHTSFFQHFHQKVQLTAAASKMRKLVQMKNRGKKIKLRQKSFLVHHHQKIDTYGSNKSFDRLTGMLIYLKNSEQSINQRHQAAA